MRPATVDLATSSGRTAHDAHDRASGRVPVYASARRHRQLPAPASIGARAASRLPRLATAAATPVHAPAGRPEPYHPPVDAASAAIDPRQAPWRRQKALAAAAFGTAALLAASALPASAAELPLSSTALDVLAGWVVSMLGGERVCVCVCVCVCVYVCAHCVHDSRRGGCGETVKRGVAPLLCGEGCLPGRADEDAFSTSLLSRALSLSPFLALFCLSLSIHSNTSRPWAPPPLPPSS